MPQITTVVFDIGNVLIRWHPERALRRHLPQRAAALAWLDRVGFYDWNLEQDRGRSLAEALPVLAATGRNPAGKVPAWAETFAETIREPIPGTRALAERLAADLGIDIPAYAAEMFAAKSDVSAFSEAELLRMDSKEYTVAGKELRVSVLETVAPQVLLARKAALVAAMPAVAAEDGADQVLLFIIDILREEAHLLVPNDLVRQIAEASFGCTVTGDTVVLPGILSRKKQIIPALTL